MKKKLLATGTIHKWPGFVLALLPLGSFAQQNALGNWEQKSKGVQITVSETQGKYFAKITSHKEHPDYAGKLLVENAVYKEKEKAFEEGKVVDPSNGSKHKMKMWVEDNTLSIRGYLAFVFKTETFTKKE